MNNIEKAAILSFVRKSRFVEGYDPKEHLETLLKDFRNSKNLYKYGLNKYYLQLKELVIKKNLIGLILYGIDKPVKTFLSFYVDTNNKLKELKVINICQHLIKDYFTKKEVIELCKKTPNFNIYYKQ